MNYLIVGVNNVDFKDVKSGAHIDGVRLYFIYPDDFNKNLRGKIADSKFLPRDLVNKFPVNLETLVNKEVNIITDIKGRIVNIIPIQK